MTAYISWVIHYPLWWSNPVLCRVLYEIWAVDDVIRCYKSIATESNPLSDNSRGDFGISSLNFDILLYIILWQCDMPWPPLQKSEKEMKEVAQNPTLSLENRHRAENIRRERSLSRVLKSQYLHSHLNNIIK